VELSMKAQCLPFQQIPHTSRLFLDYLSYTPSVQKFYPRSPIFSEWAKAESEHVSYPLDRREKVAAILERQNRSWGASAKTLANIERLKKGAFSAVTGQQVGLFGGPLFSIFKALTAVKLAEEATSAGVDCVPIFWLATEDHDLAEVDHVNLALPQGAPQRLAIDWRARTSPITADAPVGTIKFGSEIDEAVSAATELLGDSEVTQWLRLAYRPGETLGSAFALLFARLFAEFGVVLLDPADKDFHDLAKPLLKAAIQQASQLDDALLERGKAIEAAGYHQQVKVTTASALLFQVKDGARTVVRRRSEGSNGSEFIVGNARTSSDDLIAEIERAPESFNPNVLLRPVVQDYLLPTLVYAGGAAEIAYFAQAAIVYEKLLGRVTPILPRFSATLVEPKPERILSRYGLGLPRVFEGPEKVKEAIGAHSLPPDLQARFQDAYANVEKSMIALRESVGKLDSTLISTANRTRISMWNQVNRLHRRATQAELLRNEVIARHADALSQSLYPQNSLQEREIAGVSFVARYGKQLLADLYGQMNSDCHDHQVIEIQ
jgi:bacillithiol biosynthesis cysteine-adding enzyme BshC